MKFSLEFEIESKTTLANEVEIKYNDRTFIFSPDEKGILNRIKVIAPVEDPERLYSVITPNPTEGVKAHIDIKTDVDLYNSLMKNFQDLESLLALKYNIKGFKFI